MAANGFLILFWDFVLIAVGIAILIKASDITVDAASMIAKSIGVSELLIGLSVTSIGTSIPEIATTTTASLAHARGVAAAAGVGIGNIVGSNITQITLILGAAALFKSLDIQKKALLRDGLMMLLASVLLILALSDGMITNVEGMILATIYIAYLYFIFKSETMSGEKRELESKYKTVGVLIIGLAGVVFGAKLLVDSSITIAEHFGISSSIIGLTIVAVGTSLPELAVSVTAAIKGMSGLSIGNLIGSNITDPLFSMGIAASVNSKGLPVDPAILKYDAPILIGVIVLALYLMGTEWRLSRREGALLVVVYLFYLYVNFVIKV